MSHQTVIIDNKSNLYTSPSGKKYTWNQIVQLSVIMPPAEWAKAKSWWDQYCHENNCNAGIGDWQSVVNDLNTHIGISK